MKIKFAATATNAQITNDEGEEVYSYVADKLEVSLNTETAMKAVEEIVAQAWKTKQKLDAIS